MSYDYKKCAVLYVDDEPQALKYFDQAFGTTFRILTAPGVDEALKLIQEQGDSIGIVVSDQRMPKKTGVDLLTQVRKSHPNMIRMLTTAYSDLPSAIAAVNTGAVYKYITKPWDMDDLTIVLMRAMEFFIVQGERNLLFKEKLSVLQRLIVTDRVRSLSILAASLSHRLSNTASALGGYLDQTPDAVRSQIENKLINDSRQWAGSWDVVRQETTSVLKLVQKLAGMTQEPSYSFTDEVDLQKVIQDAAGLVKRGGKGTGRIDVSVDLMSDLPTFKMDRSLITQLLVTLIERSALLTPSAGRLMISATDKVCIGGTDGVRIIVTGEGPAWPEELIASMFSVFVGDEKDEMGIDLLGAFFIAYHHGGELMVRPAAPDGPGFELRLPFAPAAASRSSLESDLLGKLLTRFDYWSQV